VYVNGCNCEGTSFAGDTAVAVSTRVALLASFVLVAAVSAMVVAVVVVAGSVAVYELFSGAVSSVSPAAVVTALGGNVVRVAVLACRADVFDAVVTAFTAIMFAFRLNAFSRHFFLLLRLPCPGPGIPNVM
jgi:hypothetical protein